PWDRVVSPAWATRYGEVRQCYGQRPQQSLSGDVPIRIGRLGITTAEPRLHLLEQFLDSLGVLAAADERGVGAVNDDEILDADGGKEVSVLADENRVLRIQRGNSRCRHHVAVACRGQDALERRPVADIGPVHVHVDDEYFAGFFHDGEIDGDLL